LWGKLSQFQVNPKSTGNLGTETKGNEDEPQSATAQEEERGTPHWYPFLTSFIIDILRFEVYFGFSLRALRADSSLASLLIVFTKLAWGN